MVWMLDVGWMYYEVDGLDWENGGLMAYGCIHMMWEV